MSLRTGVIAGAFVLWLIWGPIIINSQPGTQFYMFGIDWKADNLDNTMFWLGILFLILSGVSDAYKETKDDKRKEFRARYGQEDQERDI